MLIKDKDSTPVFKCTFMCNGASELCICLHVMAEPEHHLGAADWAMKKYSKMSKELRAEVDYFSKNFAQWLFVADVVGSIVESYDGDISPENAINEIANIPDEEFAYYFLGLPAFDFEHEELAKWIENPKQVTKKSLREQADFFEIKYVRDFLADIAGYKNRIRNVLMNCWNEWFKESWTQIEAFEEEMLNKEKLEFAHSDPISYLKVFSSKVDVIDNRLVFQKSPDYSIDINDIKKLYIVPSVFSMPHTLANISNGSVNAVVNYDFRSIHFTSELNSETMAGLEAICDETRLKMMKILWERDATTKEIAELLELSQSNISLHLKQLKEADLVESRKVKRFVYYHMKKDTFYAISKSISNYLENE